MDFYYQPKIAAEVADWVNYVSPSRPPALSRSSSTIRRSANSPLVFPTTAMDAKVHDYYMYKNYNDFNTWNKTFNPIIQA